MSQSPWRVLPKGIVAEYLDESEFRGILEKRFAVPPDHLGILIRDGQLIDAFEGGHFASGGIWESLKSLLGGRHAIRFLVVDLKPFVHRSLVDGISQDGQDVQGELVLEMQVNGKKPADVIGLLGGKSTLTAGDVHERLGTHLSARVLEPELRRHAASELRGNVGLQDRIQAEILREVERLAGDLGLSLRSATLLWARTGEEQMLVRQRMLELEDMEAELDHQLVQRKRQRERSSTVFELQADLAEATARSNATVELESLLALNKLKVVDVRTTAERAAELKSLEHEAEVARRKRVALRQSQLEGASDQVERQRIELDLRRLNSEFELERKRAELELRSLELQLGRGGQMEDLKVAEASWDLQRKKLEATQGLEMSRDRERHALHTDQQRLAHEADLAKLRQQQHAEIEKLRLQGSMTPDQLLAIQAGLSPEVARVFAERARSEGSQASEKEAILREMVAMARQDSSRAAGQAESVVNAAFGRLAEVRGAAKGADSAPVAKPAVPSAPNTAEETCPSCHHLIHLGDRFCKVCGNKLRS